MNRQRFVRWLLAIPPLVLLVSSIGAVVASLAAWGAASHVGIPDWETTGIGLSFALPGLVIGGLVLREILRRTRDRFDLMSWQLTAGVVCMLVTIAIEVGQALRVADPATYDNLRNSDGTLNTSASGFLFIGLGASVLINGAVALAAYLYAEAVSPDKRSHFERRPDEPDAVGEMLHGRRGPGAQV
jgi:hypothetical protein